MKIINEILVLVGILIILWLSLLGIFHKEGEKKEGMQATTILATIVTIAIGLIIIGLYLKYA